MNASSDRERVEVLEAMLRSRLGTGSTDPLVSLAVQALSHQGENIRVSSLARRLGLSQDRLEKRFRRAVGATPKQFASLTRLRATMNAYRPDVNLGLLAAEHGFSDQSHFSRELRAMTGMSPGEFFRGFVQWKSG